MLSELFTNWTIYTNKAAVLVTLLFVIAVNLAIGILPHMMRPTPWSTSRRARLPQHPNLNEPSGRRPCPARGAGGGGASSQPQRACSVPPHHRPSAASSSICQVTLPILSDMMVNSCL
uniref:Uncharacterized protein n=1 Tax=Triticum urartu TaxID=4572 RepID=A0A8R7V336_TRIUA